MEEEEGISIRYRPEGQPEGMRQTVTAHVGTLERVRVELTSEEWKVIGFLVRQGANTELDRFMKDPTAHGADCLPLFRRAYISMVNQFPASVAVPQETAPPLPTSPTTE